MVGDSGTSRSGEKYYYYSCGKKKKRLNNCNKKSEKKDFIEWYICEQTVLYVLTDEGIKEISKRVVEEARKDIDESRMHELRREIDRLDKEIDDSIEVMIHNKSEVIRSKLEAKCDLLEQQKKSAEEELKELKFREDLLVTEEQVEKFLRSFIGGDLLNKEYRRLLINTLVNKVYIWDDKIAIYYNVRGGKQIGHLDVIDYLDELAESECSDNLCYGEPINTLSEHSTLIFTGGIFGIVIGRE